MKQDDRNRRRHAKGPLGVMAGVVVLAVVAVLVAINMTSPIFCDLVVALDIAVDAGDDVYTAVEDFYGQVTDEMLAALPDDIRSPAETLLELIDQLLAAPRAVASLLFDRMGPAIDAAALACRVAN